MKQYQWKSLFFIFPLLFSFSRITASCLSLNPVSQLCPPGQLSLRMWIYGAHLLPFSLPHTYVLVSDCLVVPLRLLQSLQDVSLFPLPLHLVCLIHFKVTYIKKMQVSPDLSKCAQVPKTNMHIRFAKLSLSDCLKYSLLCFLHKAFQTDPRRTLCFF